MFETRSAGNRPRTRQRFLVAQVGHEAFGVGAELDLNWRQLVGIGHQPRLGAVGQLAVGQQDDRGHVLDRDPDRFVGGVKAIRRRGRGDDRNRRLAVAPVHRHQQVGLFGLGRHPGGRACALDVGDNQRQLNLDRKPDGLRLEVHSGARGGGDAQSHRRKPRRSPTPRPRSRPRPGRCRSGSS